MNFRTQIPVQKNLNQIDYNSEVFLLGSCFTENIGSKLEYFKFNNTINPFGIVFHPYAIENIITNSINQKKYTEEDLFFLNERWHCFEVHSELSDGSKEKLLHKLNGAIDTTLTKIKNSTHIIITLGTAWVYRHIESDTVVANCHKVPQKKFMKELLSVDEVSESLESIQKLVKSVNPKAEIIFTVSPVRHLKDGFIENSQSKAHLLSGIHQVVKESSASKGGESYFPSYEIMMDDLRDYRFYKPDMIHPNETAIDYIWEYFTNGWITESSVAVMNKVDMIQKGLLHKPFNENSEQHKTFLESLQNKIDSLREDYNIAF